MEVITDLIYGDDPLHRWDLYKPTLESAKGPEGLIVFVHGGAWRSGDKSDHKELAQNLVEISGLPVAVPNYRLSPRIPPPPNSAVRPIKHPEHAQDIVAALSAIKESDALDNKDRSRKLYLVGHSCGAHMLSSIMLDPFSSDDIPSNPSLPEEVYDAVQGVVIVEGIYDVDLLLATFPDYRDFIHGAFLMEGETSGKSFSRFSVNHYVVKPEAKARWLVVHSPEDRLVDIPQSEAIYSQLKSEYQRIGSNLITEQVKSDFTSLKGDHDDLLKTLDFAKLVHSII